MAQNVRAIMSNGDIPYAVNKLYPYFQHVFDADRRGTHLSDMFALQDHAKNLLSSEIDDTSIEVVESVERLDRNTRGLYNNWRTLHPTDAKLLPSNIVKTVKKSAIKHRGFVFTTHSRLPRDSFVIYGTGIPDCWDAGQIQSFITVTDSTQASRDFAIVKVYCSLRPEDILFDHYRRFPLSGGRIYYQEFMPDAIMISRDEIICHFASTPNVMRGILKDHHHVLPLDRVSSAIYMKSNFNNYENVGLSYFT